MTSVRQPAVAGAFYPGDAKELDATVRSYLAQAGEPAGPAPKAVIAPHAGYIYSGQVAASAYARLKPARQSIRRVVLLGPCHRLPVRGLALSGAGAFLTPLGEVPVDREAGGAILDLPQVEVFDDSHAKEHSLEVQLPFLQVVLEGFTLVPLIVGQTRGAKVAEVIERLWGGPETLIVISSDLSHYLDYDSARRLDGVTCRAIENLDPAGIGQDQACGRVPVWGMLMSAKRRGLKVDTLGLCNSGDTAGTRERVVGYGSWIFLEADDDASERDGEEEFTKETRRLLANHGPTLLRLAAASIEHGLAFGKPRPVNAAEYPADIGREGACFVTLKRDGKLRGCIGSTEPHRPLVADVAENAFSSAFKDRRFKPLTKRELQGLALSISVLSDSQPMAFTDEADLLAQLRPGVDGLIIEDQGHRALFLPSVWELLPEPGKFMANLKAKAGMAANHWSGGFKAWRFAAGEFSTDDLADGETAWGQRR